MKKQYLINIGVVMALVGFVNAAQAEQGWYIGMGAGQAKDKVFDETDTGFKLVGGYRSNEYFAFEMSYVDLGSYPTYFGSFDEYGLGIEAIGSVPIGERFSVFARGGIFSWTVEFDGAEGEGEDLTYGLGAAIDMNEHWQIRGEWQRFDVDEGDVDLISAGFNYLF